MTPLEQIEEEIIKWLKSDNENATYLAHLILVNCTVPLLKECVQHSVNEYDHLATDEILTEFLKYEKIDTRVWE